MWRLQSIWAATADGVSATAFRSRRVRQLFAWRPARRRRFAAEGVDARADPETREPDSLAGYRIRRSARLARRAYRSDDASDRRATRQGRRLRRLDHRDVEALPRLELVPRRTRMVPQADPGSRRRSGPRLRHSRAADGHGFLARLPARRARARDARLFVLRSDERTAVGLDWIRATRRGNSSRNCAGCRPP